MLIYFFFNDTATTEIYTLSLHDALPIFANEHPRALITGNRAVRVHNGSQRSTLPRAPHLYDFFEQVHRFQAFFGGTAALGGAALSLIASAYGAPFLLSMLFAFWTLLSEG